MGISEIVINLPSSNTTPPSTTPTTAVLYTAQTLTNAQKAQARGNIDAMSSDYTPPNQTAAQVGADPTGTAAKAVSTHNTNTSAHSDIRTLISNLTAKLNALADSDDTTLDQLSEIVAYIENNKTLIEGVTTNKVNVADIINNLTTSATNKPLSAKQGVVLKGLIDTINANQANYILKNQGAANAGKILVVGADGNITFADMTEPEGGYTNQIPISTDTDGSIYDGDGFAEGMYLSGGKPTSRSGIDCSGFIPVGCGSSVDATGEQVVRMLGITAALNTSFRIAFYGVEKNYLNQTIYGSQFDSNNLGVTVPYELDEDGNVTKFDLTAVTAKVATMSNAGTTAFIRISCPNIDSESILTVNEEITE